MTDYFGCGRRQPLGIKNEFRCEMTGGSEKNRVIMVNDELRTAPVCELSPELTVHWYERGDEDTWTHIQAVADKHNVITSGVFLKQFCEARLDLCERQCFLVHQEGGTIATGTAWAAVGGKLAGYGRVHWIAVLPEWQGRGIGAMLMSIVCQRLIALGHERAFLTTSRARRPAMRLYEKFGFRSIAN